MSKKLIISIVAATAIVTSSSSHAAISDDGLGGDEGQLTKGLGLGELFFVAFDPSRAQSVVFDLEITTEWFRANSNSSFSVSNPGLALFLSNPSENEDIVWNIGGISNKGFGPDLGILTTHGAGNVSAGVTIDENELPQNGSALTSAMLLASGFLTNANNGLGATGKLHQASSSAPDGFLGGSWGPRYGGVLNFQNTQGLDDAAMMSFIFADENDVLDGRPKVHGPFLGKWEVDIIGGAVAYVVPLPAGIWMTISALAALGFTARRKI